MSEIDPYFRPENAVRNEGQLVFRDVDELAAWVKEYFSALSPEQQATEDRKFQEINDALRKCSETTKP